MMNERQEREMIDTEFVVVDDEKPEKCIDCPINRVCPKAFSYNGKLTKSIMEDIDCHYEKMGNLVEKRKLFVKWQSFVDNDPKYFLEKMMVSMDNLEEEEKKNPSFAKKMQLMYLGMSIYKMKFGERKEIQQNIVNASVDIKALMDKVRENQLE